MDITNKNKLQNVVCNALSEDLGGGDITCKYVLTKKTKVKAVIVLKQKEAVICGLDVLKEVFKQINKNTKIVFHAKDGSFLKKRTKICTITGYAEDILKAERTALNFLGRLSGIATMSRIIARKVEKYKAVVLDTRKTTPGLRFLEKYAVKAGGCSNHRQGLFDQILIKDNHIGIIKNKYPSLSLCDIIKRARNRAPKKTIIEIEVSNLIELKDALAGKPDIIMLDNMGILQMKKAVQLRDELSKSVKLEASGNITLKNIASVAKCGVDFISSGMLTHSVVCTDFSLKIIKF